MDTIFLLRLKMAILLILAFLTHCLSDVDDEGIRNPYFPSNGSGYHIFIVQTEGICSLRVTRSSARLCYPLILNVLEVQAFEHGCAYHENIVPPSENFEVML